MSKTLFDKSIDFINANQLDRAVDSLETYLKTTPSDQSAQYILGQVLTKLSRWKQAIPHLEQVIKIDKENTQANYCLALCYEKTKNYPQAIDLYKQVIQKDKQHWQAMYHMALILLIDNQEILAIRYLEEALKYQKQDHELLNAMAEAHKRVGHFKEANYYTNEAYKLAPSKDLLGVKIFMMHFDPNKGLEDFMLWAQKYNDQYLAGIEPQYDFSNRQPKNKIRLGFVSADYRNHPISSYLISIFERIDREQFEIYLYYNKDDIRRQTDILQGLADKFEFVKESSDEELADMIYEHEIDILFDMSGYTAGERLAMFKRKPAPVQITHQGYFGTLAIPEIDYIIADETIIKTGEEQYFTEKIIKLRSFAHANLYAVPEPVSEPPCLKNGYVTFCAMNSMKKISPTVLETWIEVLKAVPGSKIQFDSKVLVIDTNREYFYKIFEQEGITRDRVLIDATVERADYLLNFNKVDIMLDTFPYAGGTSSLEASMMGVPIITLAGDRWVGRMTESFYRNLGREELIAQSREDYVLKAIELANDFERIAQYRKSLPQELKNSPLNIDDFVADFEAQMKVIAKVYSTCGDNFDYQYDE